MSGRKLRIGDAFPIDIPDADMLRNEVLADEESHLHKIATQNMLLFIESLKNLKRHHAIRVEKVYSERFAVDCAVCQNYHRAKSLGPTYVLGTWQEFEDAILPKLEASKFCVEKAGIVCFITLFQK